MNRRYLAWLVAAVGAAAVQHLSALLLEFDHALSVPRLLVTPQWWLESLGFGLVLIGAFAVLGAHGHRARYEREIWIFVFAMTLGCEVLGTGDAFNTGFLLQLFCGGLLAAIIFGLLPNLLWKRAR